MSDSKKPKPLPPDDFSKTTPNIPVSDDLPGGWEKTNYNFPTQPPADDWGKTVANVTPKQTDEPDFGKTFLPSSKQTPKDVEWGVTEANINIPDDAFGEKDDDSGRSSGRNEENFGATTPYFRLPETERAKYQNIPPTPTEEAAEKKKEEKAGIPGWVWVSGGLLTMFLFTVFIFLIVYFFIIPRSGYEVTVKGAPTGSDIFIDGQRYNLTSSDGTYRLPNIRAGKHKIEIKHPNFTCDSEDVDGKDGVNPPPITAKCRQKAGSGDTCQSDDDCKDGKTCISGKCQSEGIKEGDDCNNIQLGEEDKAERCYNTALDKLPPAPDYTADELVKALNILIINFDRGKYDIPAVRMKALKRASVYIKQLPPTTTLEIGGHTDSDGSDADNQILSDNRAKAVKKALEDFGVNPSMLQTKGYGETSPKVPNTTSTNKFHNRRIEYSVVKK